MPRKLSETYGAIHQWVRLNWGKPNECEFCGVGKGTRFEWAMIKGQKCQRLRSNWLRLCSACHRAYDMTGRAPWNKGRKGLQKNHNFSGLLGGGWNKGKKTPKDVRAKLSKAHLGKKPWNKGIKYRHLKNRYLIEQGIVNPKES